MIGHTRLTTCGSEVDLRNNHPIWHHDVVGIHNGMIQNYHEILAYFPREDDEVEVDSEAIFAAVSQAGDEWGLAVIDGSVATCYTRLEHANSLVLARTLGSPLYVASTTQGSFVFASEARVINDSGLDINHIERIDDDGVYCYITQGQPSDWWIFDDELYNNMWTDPHDIVTDHWNDMYVYEDIPPQNTSADTLNKIDEQLDALIAQAEERDTDDRRNMREILARAESLGISVLDDDSGVPDDI